MVALSVLGPVEVRASDGTPVRVGSARQRRLVAALALRAGQPVGVDLLAELVWDDDQPADPSGAVQTNVARLRRLLPDGVRIDTEPTGYRLVADAGSLDVAAFEDHLARGAATADPERRAAHLDAALLLWRGRPFADLDHPEVMSEATRLAELRASAVESRAEALLAAGRIDDAIAVLEAFVTDVPLRERPVGLLMRALTAAGRQADALRAYSRLRETLVDELGLDPSPELQELEQQVLRQELPVGGGRPAGRVPLPVSTFVGREAEVEAVVELLGACRLVTLCGPGGVGKSRLALHAADAAAGSYADGVAVVSLATLVRGEDVDAAVAGALRISGHAGEELRDRLAEVLAVRRLLLVLDDCEHVIEAVAALVDTVVRAAPGLDVLATSREPLRADGEHVYAVTPLGHDEAARLLADRAAAAAPGTPVTDLDDVVRRLDGLPLAIELAAARLPSLGVPGLAAALDEPFDVLRGGRRGGRHRSLLEVVDWSYRSLEEEERVLFDRIAVFDGAVDAVAIKEVCGAPATAIADLVDRSLLTAHPGERPTYSMLGTLRAYGRRRAAEAGTGTRHRDAHASWAARLGSELLDEWARPGSAAARRRFDAHAADLRSGFERLVRQRRLDELGDLGVLLATMGYERMRDDLVRTIEDAIPLLWDEVHPSAASVIGWSGPAQWQRGAFDEARRRAARCLELAEAVGEPALGREGHSVLANVSMFEADLVAAREHVVAARELVEDAGRASDYVLHRIDEVLLAAYTGDHELAERAAAEIRARAEASGSPAVLAWASYCDGERLAERDPAAAVPHLERAITLAEQVDATFLSGVARHTLLTGAARRLAAPDALAGFGPLVDHWHRAGAWTQLWMAVRALVEALSRGGRHDDVVRLVSADRASARSGEPFGADLARRDEALATAAAALGERYEALVAEGEAMGDEGTIAFARSLTST